MKNLKEKLKKIDYKFLIINLIIIVSYVLILSAFGLHGHDDEFAYTYYSNPAISFIGKIKQILGRSINWNLRIGELLYFTFGAFPLWVSYIMHSIIMITFLNLVVYYALGYDKYKKSNIKNILLIVTFLIFMLVNPIISEVFFWTGGIFNHLFSIVIILLVGIPFRNLMDNYDNLNCFNKKYILYLIFCFLASFNVESTVATLIVGLFVINLVLLIKNKKIDILKLLPLIVLCIGFLMLLLLSKNRVIAQSMNSYNVYTKENMFSLFMANRLLQIIMLVAMTLLYFIVFKLNNINQYKKRLYILLVSFSSFIAMMFSPYYVDRGVLILDVGIVIYVIYILYKIIDKIKNKFVFVPIYILLTIVIIFVTYNYRQLFIDYNEFDKIRDSYIREQIKEGKEFIFYTYDNKYNIKLIYKFSERLINIIDGNSSTTGAIEFKYGYKGNYYTEWDKNNIILRK